jgi:hypothetical protein
MNVTDNIDTSLHLWEIKDFQGKIRVIGVFHVCTSQMSCAPSSNTASHFYYYLYLPPRVLCDYHSN